MRRLVLTILVVLCLIAVPGPNAKASADPCDNCLELSYQMWLAGMSLADCWDWYVQCLEVWGFCEVPEPPLLFIA